MAIKNRYFSRIPSCKMIFKNGKEAAFVGGVFDTDIASEIEELDAEVAAGHPHIYTEKEQLTVDTEQLDPLAEIKKRAIEEYLAAQAAASKLDNDRGTTEDTKLNVTSTADIAGAAADSSAGQVIAAQNAPVTSVAAPVAPSVLKISK